MSNNQEILDRLARGVRDMDEELTVAAAQEALQNNIGALQAINEGLVTGMNDLVTSPGNFITTQYLCCAYRQADPVGFPRCAPTAHRSQAANDRHICAQLHPCWRLPA